MGKAKRLRKENKLRKKNIEYMITVSHTEPENGWCNLIMTPHRVAMYGRKMKTDDVISIEEAELVCKDYNITQNNTTILNKYTWNMINA